MSKQRQQKWIRKRWAFCLAALCLAWPAAAQSPTEVFGSSDFRLVCPAPEDGYVPVYNGTTGKWECGAGGGGGGGTPGGSDLQFQYRVNASTFGGATRVEFDSTNFGIQFRDADSDVVTKLNEVLSFWSANGSTENTRLGRDVINAMDAWCVKWSSTSAWNGVKDVGLCRNAAGELRVSDGSSGFGNLAVKNLTLRDPADPTKIATFSMNNIGTGTTRTFAFPNATGTLALETSNVATATALASDPSDCEIGQWVTGINAAGEPTCAAPTHAGLPDLDIPAHHPWAEQVANKDSNGGYVGRDGSGNASIPGTFTAGGFSTPGATANLSRWQACWPFLDDAADLTDTLDKPSIFKFADDFGVVVDKIVAEVTNCSGACTTETVTLNFQRDDGSPADVMTADLVADVGGQSSCASGCDVNTISATEGDFSAGHDLDFRITSISSGVRGFTVCVFGTKQ